MTCLIVQFSKGCKFIEKLPTQVWSYIVAAVLMLLAMFFTRTNGIHVSDIFLTLLNAVIVALASNGAFSGIQKASQLSRNS